VATAPFQTWIGEAICLFVARVIEQSRYTPGQVTYSSPRFCCSHSFPYQGPPADAIKRGTPSVCFLWLIGDIVSLAICLWHQDYQHFLETRFWTGMIVSANCWTSTLVLVWKYIISCSVLLPGRRDGICITSASTVIEWLPPLMIFGDQCESRHVPVLSFLHMLPCH